MNKFKVQLDKKNIPSFCRKLIKFDSEFDVHNNRTFVDGKDIKGFYHLNIDQPLEIQCILSHNESLEKIKEDLKEFII